MLSSTLAMVEFYISYRPFLSQYLSLITRYHNGVSANVSDFHLSSKLNTVWASPERHLIILVISGINPRDFFITRVKERLNKETDEMNIQTFRSSFVFLCCHRHSVISVVGCL